MSKDGAKPMKMQMPSKEAKKISKVASGGHEGKIISKSGNEIMNFGYAKSGFSSTGLSKGAQAAGASAAGIMTTQPMFFSPLHTPQNWQIASKRKEVYQWARFYYDNEPKVAAGVDFYSTFPMNGFSLECKSKKVLKYFERIVDKLRLDHWFKIISREYFLIGDVFVFTEIKCPHCGGSGTSSDGSPCNHPDGNIDKIMVLNPDWVEVHSTQLADEPLIVLQPDEELKRIVATRKPEHVYNQLPDIIKALVASGRPIPLSNRSTSHLKYNGSPYGTYGESMLRRLFTTLAYKTKLMTANWIIAERLVLPVRVVKVGDKDRPASDSDIADVQEQLAVVSNDPNLTLVTHHAFDYEWYGASGKIHNITTEIEQIGKEILDGLMLNQSLLNGEMSSYSSAQVGVETMIRRLESWRNTLADWAEKNIFLPIAQMQGFIDEDLTKELNEDVHLYPKIKWNDLRLRDNSNHLQMMIQLHDKQIISTQKLCEEFDIDYDQEIMRIREEQQKAMQNGMIPGMGGGSPMGGGMDMGGLGGLGGMGGGMPGGDMGEGAMPGADMGAGAMPGADMGAGGMAGGATPGGDMGASASVSDDLKVYKKGKAPKKEEVEAPKMKTIAFTKPEQKILQILKDLNLPYELFAQYKQPSKTKPQPYSIDFAYPRIGVAIEADGDKWHTEAKDKERDKKRDMELASMGWRVLRFTESAINEHADIIKKAIYTNVLEAVEENKKMLKKSSVQDMKPEVKTDGIGYHFTKPVF